MKVIKISGYKEGILTGIKMAMIIARPRGRKLSLEDNEEKYRWLEREIVYNELREMLKYEEDSYSNNANVSNDSI